MAVYGDAPYGTTPTRHRRVRRDPGVHRLGQRRPGRQHGRARRRHPLRQAVLHRRPTTSRSPTCGRSFADPLVYTPGDNEWTDCHKTGEGGGTYNATTGQINYVLDGDGQPVDYAGGDPVDNLALVRSIFFAAARPHARQRHAAGASPRRRPYDPAHPTDAQYVENVMWEQRRRRLRDAQRPRRLEQRRRPLVRRADRLARSRPTETRPAHRRRPALARRGLRARPSRERAAGVVIIDPGRHVGPRRQDRRPPDQLRADRRQHRRAHDGVRQARCCCFERRLARLPLGQPAAAGRAVHR